MKTPNELLIESNELLRSLNSIVERKGHDTNWNAIQEQLKKVLAEQHSFIYGNRSLDPRHVLFAKIFESEKIGQIVVMKENNPTGTVLEDSHIIAMYFNYMDMRATLTIGGYSEEIIDNQFAQMNAHFVEDFILKALNF